MLVIEIGEENVRRRVVMRFPILFNIKKEKQKEARKFYFGAVLACLMLAARNYDVTKNIILVCFFAVFSFVGLSYYALGLRRLYKVRKFKKHKVWRWCVFSLAVICCTFWVVWYLTKGTMTDVIGLLFPVIILLMAITFLHNGYVDE